MHAAANALLVLLLLGCLLHVFSDAVASIDTEVFASSDSQVAIPHPVTKDRATAFVHPPALQFTRKQGVSAALRAGIGLGRLYDQAGSD